MFQGKEETFHFLEAVFKEVIELFPSPYIHIGGDEVRACLTWGYSESQICISVFHVSYCVSQYDFPRKCPMLSLDIVVGHCRKLSENAA